MSEKRRQKDWDRWRDEEGREVEKRRKDGRDGGREERGRGKRREERDARVSYCQCNFEDGLLVQLMCQHVCLLHKSVGVQHSVDETLPILVLPLFLETVSVGVFVCERVCV